MYPNGPAICHVDTGFVSFLLSASKFWDRSQIPNYFCMILSQPRLFNFIRYKPLALEALNCLTKLYISKIIIMWRVDPLLGNCLVNTFPREPTRVTIECLLLGNRSVNTPKTMRDNRRRCFPWGSPWGYIKGISKGAVSCQKLTEFSWRRIHLSELLSRIGSSSGGGSLRRLRINCKKGIRLWREDFICDSKWQWYCYKSVARIRLVKTENPSACMTVKSKVCKSI
jgi:hypothetical protein